MALSTYFNWDSTPQTLNAEINMTNFHEPTQELFPYLDETFFLPNTLFEPYFDPTCNFLYPSHDLLSCTSSYEYDPIMSSLSDITPTEDYYNLALPCPKRQKWYHEEQQQQLNHSSSLQDQLTPSNIFDGFVSNNPFSFQADEVPELFSPVLPELFKVPQLPPPCGVGNADDLHQYCEKKTNNEKTTISAQSVAARERRRKITEKTQELGKLVPGGPKMNTAEMLHAATKYVKYLQAQVGMLQLINTLEENEAAPPTEDLHALVVSPFVQEKLSSEEMCLVPKDFVNTLTNHEDVQSTPTVLKDLGINMEKKVKQE